MMTIAIRREPRVLLPTLLLVPLLALLRVPLLRVLLLKLSRELGRLLTLGPWDDDNRVGSGIEVKPEQREDGCRVRWREQRD